MNRHSLSRPERVTRTSEFKEALKNGEIYRGKTINVIIARNNSEVSRIGISLRRENFRLATQRNRLRRYLKEIFRLDKHIFKKGFDIIALPKTSCSNLTFNELRNEVIEVLRKADVLTRA